MNALQAMRVLAEKGPCGRVPTAGAIAFHTGRTYAATQVELRAAVAGGFVTETYDRASYCNRYTLTLEGALSAAQATLDEAVAAGNAWTGDGRP